VRSRAVNLLVLLALLMLPSAAFGGGREAAKRVREGITHFVAGDFEKASKAFAEADVALPDDAWIGFDRACADAAQGDADKATERFEQSALSRDVRLAVQSRYNLGSIAAEKARALFGEKPEEASVEVREEGLALLTQAVGHYRDCLQLDAAHADARHNLEVIRLWIKHMHDVWQKRDRQKQREEMDLLEFLQMIETEQRGLRTAVRGLAPQPDSPQRRQALVTTESSQRELAEEIEPLKEKIEAALGSTGQAAPSSPQAGGPQSGAALSPEDQEKAIELLANVANDARAAMFTAADELHGSSVVDAVGSQAEVVEKLDQIYTAVAPFPGLVQRAIGTEQALIDQVAPAVENPDERQQLDSSETAWEQRFVAGWAEALAPKAEQALKGLEGLDPSAMASTADGAQPGAPDAETMKKMQEEMEGLKQSMEEAVELGPKVFELTDQSATHLDEEKPAEALPKQEEALKLLKEIADPLPKQDQQQQGDQQQDQEENDQEKKQNQEQSGEKQQDRQPREASQREAEAVLKKVRERQRDRRDLEKQLQQHIYRRGAVEKDW